MARFAQGLGESVVNVTTLRSPSVSTVLLRACSPVA